LRSAAPDTVDFAWLAASLILLSALLEKVGKVLAEDQQGPFLINGLKSALDPLANGVPVNAQACSDFLNGIVTVNLDESMIRVTG